MDIREWTWIDRAAQGWPQDRQWDSEPDKVHWKDSATGMDCLAVRSPTRGNWCGYVAVREGHPAFGKDYGEARRADGDYLEAHGGLTFSGFCDPHEGAGPERGICHVPYPGDPDHVWWLGFDCAHAWDYSPDDLKRSAEGYPWTIGHDQQYRTLNFVKRECAQLAAQLAEKDPQP